VLALKPINHGPDQVLRLGGVKLPTRSIRASRGQGCFRAGNGPPDWALPHYRVGNKILVRRSEFDRWLDGHRHRGRPSLEKALRELGLGGLLDEEKGDP
jgi:hypothetical protein